VPLDPAVIQEKNKLAGSAPWIWLAELHPTSVERVYLCADNQPVTFDSNEYLPYPFSIEMQEHDGKGNLMQVTLVVPNTNYFISDMLERSRGFTGRKVILSLINDGNLVLRQTFRVQTSTVNEASGQFIIGFDDLLKISIPATKYFRDRCPWRYKGVECKYAGALQTCDRTLRSTNGCEAHENTINFGGYPGIPKLG
jgi:phage-related protein